MKKEISTVTNEAEEEVIYFDGEWKLDINGIFMNAVLGGISDAVKAPKGSM